MADNLKCQRCRAPVSNAGPYGHCPACLLSMALGESVDAAKFSPVPPAESKRCFGDYELIDEISRGGMGVVYRARQISLNRPVALKMILEGAQASASAVARFQIEAEAAAQLNHPNIVPVFESGVYSGRRFLSMKLVEGGTLADQLAEFAAAPPKRSAAFIAIVAEAVHHAHQRGVLHRDLKPSNILIDASGQPHITDFGLAKLLEEQIELTQAGSPLGTPAYMAPEQVSGHREATTAADVYGLGAILYHLLTGEPPFQGATALEIMNQVVDKEPVPPNRLNPAVGHGLATICLKCLSKEPERRYTSAQALADDLTRWRNGDTISAVPETRADAIARWVRRNPALAAMVIVTLFLLATVAIVSTTAAFRINRARQASVAAEAREKEKLWESYLAQARAQRLSGKPGRRFETLAAISNAVNIRRSIELRNEAIAALALTDVRTLPFSPPDMSNTLKFMIDMPRDRYAAGFSNGSVSVRKLADHSELMRLPATGKQVDGFTEFSADGNWLVVSYRDRTFSVWNIEQSKLAATFTNPLTVVFRPDSRAFAVGKPDGTISVVSTETLTETAHFSIPAPMNALIWNPSGTAFAATAETNLSIVSAGTGEILRLLQSSNLILNAAWHPDGKHIAVGTVGHPVYIFDTQTGLQSEALAGHMSPVTAVSYTPDGKYLMSGSWDGTLRLWDLATAAEVLRWPAGSERIFISPDSRRVGVMDSGFGEMELFELTYNDIVASAPVSSKIKQNYDALLFGHDANWLATAAENVVEFWRPDTMQPIGEKRNLTFGASAFLAPKKELFSFEEDGFFCLKAQETNGAIAIGESRKFHPSVPEALLTQFDSGIFGPFDSTRGYPERIGASTNGLVIAVGFKDHCYVFNMASNALQAVTGEHEVMRFVAVSPDGRRVATGAWNNTNTCIWSAATGAKERELETGFSTQVAFSPDGKWLATSIGPEVCFWRTSDWEIDHRVERPHERLSSPLAFSGDGRTLAMAMTRGTVKLVVAATGETLAQFEPNPANEIVALALNPEASELAMTRADEPVEIWHLKKIRDELKTWGLDW